MMEGIGDRGSGVGDYARRVMERADALGGISEEADRLTRRFATPAMRQANEVVAGWMREAGMTVRHDNIGNLFGRYKGSGVRGQGSGAVHETVIQNPKSKIQNPKLLFGSHLDT